jgi:hypothetical protein
MTTGNSYNAQTANTVCQIKSQLIQIMGAAAVFDPGARDGGRSAKEQLVTEKVLLPLCGYDDSEILEFEFEALERAGGVVLSPERRVRILRRISEYRSLTKLYLNSPRASEVKPKLEKIEACTRDLIELLNEPAYTDPSQAGALRLLREEGLRLGCGSGASPQQIALVVQNLNRAAASALERLPADFGAGVHSPCAAWLIRSLHSEFLEAGGIGETSKKSLAFLDQGCRLAGVQWPKDRGWDALKTAVRAAVREKSRSLPD